MISNERGIVKITDIEYLQLLSGTADDKRDYAWCMKMKMHLKKLQYLTGYDQQTSIDLVDERYEREMTPK